MIPRFNIVFFLTTVISSIYSLTGFAQEANFFIAAHQDDWQLFMNPNVYNSIKGANNNKTVLIHLTAGDAGQGAGYDLEPYPYYQARNEGALRAIRFMVNTFGGNLGVVTEASTVTLNGHRIQRHEYDSVVSYFLLLPDGNPSGTGYEGTDYESLERLYQGTNSQIQAVDDSATYTSWDDLVNTMTMLVNYETQMARDITFHSADTDRANPRDHSDHRYSSLLFQEVAQRASCIHQNFYLTYVTSSMAQNVFDDDFLVQIGSWGATTSGISDFYHRSTWDTAHNNWLGKQYFRRQAASCERLRNIASQAEVRASSENTATGQTADKAVDGLIGGAPLDPQQEWVTDGETGFALLTLTWEENVSISAIHLYDRPNLNDQIISSLLILGGGTWTWVPELDNSGKKTTITFPEVETVNTLTLWVMRTSSTTQNIGLAEIEVMTDQ